MGNGKSKGEKKKKKAEGQKKDLGIRENGPISVVLKVEMHCEDCAEKERQRVEKFEGVEAAASNVAKNELTVIGRLDPLKLRNHLESELHKHVYLISPAVPVKKKERGEETATPKKDGDGAKAKSEKKGNDNEANGNYLFHQDYERTKSL